MPPRTTRSPTDRTQATVAMGFVTGMLAGLKRHGLDPGPLLAASGVDIADPATRIPVDRYAALYNLINRRLDDEAFGLFAQPLRVGSFEFLCRGCIGAPTLAAPDRRPPCVRPSPSPPLRRSLMVRSRTSPMPR